jgi:hypothetical protein
MFRLCLVFVNVLLLAACTGVTSPTATPPTTIPPRSLAQIDLEALVIQPGDLPPMDATPQKIPLSAFSPGLRPGVAASFARLLQKGEYVMGHVYVDVYTDTVDAERAYEEVIALLYQGDEKFGYRRTAPAIGDQATLEYHDHADVVFRRCHANILIGFPPSKDTALVQDTILAYAQRLDARLKPLVCP